MSKVYSFYVHRNGAIQNLYNAQYNRIMFTTKAHDDYGLFDFVQSRWIAPAEGVVNFNACAFVNAGLALNSNANSTFKFIRNSSAGVPPAVPNGVDCFAIVGGPQYPLTTGVGITSGGGWWRVAEGDAIEMALYTTSASGGNSVVLDGHPAHTYWSGAFFPD